MQLSLCCRPRFSQLQRLTLIHWKFQVHPVLKVRALGCPAHQRRHFGVARYFQGVGQAPGAQCCPMGMPAWFSFPVVSFSREVSEVELPCWLPGAERRL